MATPLRPRFLHPPMMLISPSLARSLPAPEVLCEMGRMYSKVRLCKILDRRKEKERLRYEGLF